MGTIPYHLPPQSLAVKFFYTIYIFFKHSIITVGTLSFYSLSSSNFYTVSLQNAIWKQLLVFNKSKLLEFYKLIALNYVSPTDPRVVEQFKNCISMQAENRLSAPKQVAMQTVISKLVNKIYLLSRLKWWHKTCAYIHLSKQLYLAPTCVKKL